MEIRVDVPNDVFLKIKKMRGTVKEVAERLLIEAVKGKVQGKNSACEELEKKVFELEGKLEKCRKELQKVKREKKKLEKELAERTGKKKEEKVKERDDFYSKVLERISRLNRYLASINFPERFIVFSFKENGVFCYIGTMGEGSQVFESEGKEKYLETLLKEYLPFAEVHDSGLPGKKTYSLWEKSKDSD